MAARWPWNDQAPEVDLVLTPRQSSERHRLRRLTTGTAALTALALVGTVTLPLPALLLSSLSASWFLVVSTKIPRLRDQAGLPLLSQHGHVLHELADSFHIPPSWYTSGLRRTVAPLTLALGALGVTAGVAGTAVELKEQHVRTSTAADHIQGQSPPQAVGRPAPGASGLNAGTDGRPYCAEYSSIAADLRRGAAPENVTVDLEAAWRRINWPTLGCVAAPPQKLGIAWVVRLHGDQGDGLLVHVAGQARVVHDRFAAHVLTVANQLRGLSDRVDFGAGQYHLVDLPDGCHALMASPQRGVLLVPAGSTTEAARLGEAVGAFPWITELQPNQVYNVSLLMAIDSFPGYVEVSTAQVATSLPPAAQACSGVGLTYQRLAAPLSAMAQRHRRPTR